MLTAAARARLTVVLAGARNPSNIGAAARAMRDFGFSDLRFVNEYTAPFEAAQLEAVKSAVAAGEVMRHARSFTSLAEAIADCTLVAGTTAIGERSLALPVQTLAGSAPHLLGALQNAAQTAEQKVALVFGSEKTGLTNEQLSQCSLLLTIPLIDPTLEAREAPLAAVPDGPVASNTVGLPRHLSMNLGQAVAVCLYELARAGLESGKALPLAGEALPATGADRERVTALLLQAMETSGYARRFPANSREHVVRRLVQQLGTSHDEAMTWMGFLKLVTRRNGEGPVIDEAP